MPSGMKVGDGYVEVRGDTSKLSSDVALGGKNFLSAGLGLGTKIVGGLAIGASAAVVGGIGAVAGMALSKGLDRALSIQDSTAKLQGLGHSAAEVQGIMNNALASVKGTAFGLGEAATVAASAVAAGIAPGAKLTSVLTTIADTATIAGTSMSDMGSIFNSVAANGKVSGQDIASLQDQGVPALQFLAKHYKITAAAASQMVTDGKVDFANFAAAMQENVGGAALKSGQTARGAWANVQSALGRLGAAFLSPAIATAPSLFTSMSTALDRMNLAITPLVSALGIRLSGAMTTVGGMIDKISFDGILAKARTVVDGVKAVFSTVSSGNAIGKTMDIAKVFGLDRAPMIITLARNLHDTLAGLLDVGKILGGDTSDATAVDLSKRFGLDAAPTIYALATSVHDAVAGMLKGVDFGAVAKGLSPLGTILSTAAPALAAFAATMATQLAPALPSLAPLLVTLGKGFTDIGNALGGALGAALPTVAGLVTTLAGAVPPLVTAITVLVPPVTDLVVNLIKLVTPLLKMPGVVGGAAAAFGVYKTVMEGIDYGKQIVGLYKTAAAFVAAAIPRAASIIETGVLITMYTAQAIATGVVAAATWVFAAAMAVLTSPITLIVLGVAALIAVVILLVTHWSAVTAFLSTVWNAAVTGVIAGLTWLKGMWDGIWSTFVLAIAIVWGTIVSAVMAYLTAIQTGIGVALNFVISIWNAGWNILALGISIIWGTVVGIVNGGLAVVRGAVAAGLAFISGAWSAGWNALSGIVRSAAGVVVGAAQGLISSVQGIIGRIGGIFAGIRGAVTGALSGAGGWLLGAGEHIIDGLVSGIRNAIGKVKAILGSVTSLIPSWKGPAELDKRLLTPNGSLIMGGLIRGIEMQLPALRSSLSGITTTIPTVVAGGTQSLSAASPGVQAAGAGRSGNTYVLNQSIPSNDPVLAGRQAARAFADRLK